MASSNAFEKTQGRLLDFRAGNNLSQLTYINENRTKDKTLNEIIKERKKRKKRKIHRKTIIFTLQCLIHFQTKELEALNKRVKGSSKVCFCLSFLDFRSSYA